MSCPLNFPEPFLDTSLPGLGSTPLGLSYPPFELGLSWSGDALAICLSSRPARKTSSSIQGGQSGDHTELTFVPEMGM